MKTNQQKSFIEGIHFASNTASVNKQYGAIVEIREGKTLAEQLNLNE